MVIIVKTTFDSEGETSIMNSRLTLDAASYLPILFERELVSGGIPSTKWVTLIENEFVDAGSLPDDFFEPTSIGYLE